MIVCRLNYRRCRLYLQSPSLATISLTIEKLGAYVVVVLSVVILSRYTTFSTILRVYGCVCMNVVGLVCVGVCNDFFEWMTLH